MNPEHVHVELEAQSFVPERLAVTDQKGALADGRTEFLKKGVRPVIAFKFGGTSLLGASRMRHAAGLVRSAAQTSNVIVIVSAMKGITDRLLSISRLLAEAKISRARNEAESVIDLHLDALQQLELDEENQNRIRQGLQHLAADLLHETLLQRHANGSEELADRLASFGERFSARLFAAALEKSGVAAVPVSSSDFVLTCDTFREAKPNLEETRARGREILLPLLEEGLVPVVTGFIGATPDGRITTLGRNSSDFSGAIVAHAVDAEELVIWTDVDGIYTHNPRNSAEAKLLHDLSYDEAHALAAGGATVLHPHVLPLAAETETVIWIRNTFNPHVRGTRIGLPGTSKDCAPHGGAA